MKRGPRPQPTRLRIIRGNPGHRPLPKGEPQPDIVMPVVPEEVVLLPNALRKWNDLAPRLHRAGILSELDGDALAGYCVEYHHYLEMEAFVRENGSVMVVRDDKGAVKWTAPVPQESLRQKHLAAMNKIGAELGLSPSARTRLNVDPKKPAHETASRWKQIAQNERFFGK